MGKTNVFGLKTKGLFDNERYESTVLSYGAIPMRDEHSGRFYLGLGETMPMRAINTIDRLGDKILRAFDDGFLVAVRCRDFRGSIGQIKVLGLSEYYGAYERDGKFLGIEIKKPEIFKHGMFLQDIIHYHLVERLVEWDSIIEICAKHLALLHAYNQAVGEVLPSDFLLRRDKNMVGGFRVVMNVPDIVWCNDNIITLREKQAIDLADLVMGFTCALLKDGYQVDFIRKSLANFLKHYRVANYVRGKEIILATQQQLKSNFAFTLHNVARMALWTVPDRMDTMKWASEIANRALEEQQLKDVLWE